MPRNLALTTQRATEGCVYTTEEWGSIPNLPHALVEISKASSATTLETQDLAGFSTALEDDPKIASLACAQV